MLLLIVLISGKFNYSMFWKDYFSSILILSGSSDVKLRMLIMSTLSDVQYSENLIVITTITFDFCCCCVLMLVLYNLFIT